MKEEWKDVEGYEKLYQISNLGKIRRIVSRRTKEGLASKRFGKLLKKAISGSGYMVINLSQHGKTKTFYFHRLLAQHFISNPQNKRTVNHIDYNKLNNNIDNLEWMSQKENINHAWNGGICTPHGCCGEDHGMCKLTRDDVMKIKKRLVNKTRGTVKELSVTYNVHPSAIYRILNNKTWVL